MEKQIIYRQYPVTYRIEGKGKPVVFIHGFGEAGTIWDEQINFLATHCQLIVPDIPGSGKSPYHPTLESIDDYAEVINTILTEEKIDRCIMLGHSMGGYITLAFAEYYPHKLSGFGLIHSTAFADSEEKKNNRLRGIAMMEEYGAYAFLRNTIPNLFSLAFKEAKPNKIESLIEQSRLFTKEACQQYYKAMMNRPDRTALLKNNPLPVLFVCGKEDVAAPLNDLLQQIHLPECSYIHIMDRVGHMGMWEATEKVNYFLLEFISYN
ncbi:MAG: alpha/beta hydrolase [Bacteroidota bacterium]|nr:alpha/beta hydrolase [Bacteroidota bacterium]